MPRRLSSVSHPGSFRDSRAVPALAAARRRCQLSFDRCDLIALSSFARLITITEYMSCCICCGAAALDRE